MTKALVIGDGGWGTALALVLHANGSEVTVWGPFPENIDDVRARRENRQFLPGVALPPDIRWTTDIDEAADGPSVVILAIPTRHFRSVVERFAGKLPPAAALVSVAKGLDQTSYQRMTEVAAEVLGHRRIAALSGPSHAEEVARGVPTAVVVASEDADCAQEVQQALTGRLFRAYTSQDVCGVELGGAFKNVIAVAVGVSDGIGFGDNTRAALITRGLVEITRLGCALGAQKRTFAGLSGMGDLIVTCTSRHSRNRSVGEQLGQGKPLDTILGEMKQVAEGVWNCRAAQSLARRHQIEAPITDEVCAIVHEHKDPAEAVTSLMTRELKSE